MTDPNRKRLPKAVVEELAALAKIPAGQMQDFKAVVDLPVLTAWAVDRRSTPERRPEAALREAAKHARQLRAALERLNDADKVWLEKLWSLAPISYRLPDPVSVSTELQSFLNLAVGHAGMSGPAHKTKQPGTIHDLGFYELVRGLLLVTEGWCTGKLTLHNEPRSGTLIDALNLLRPLLPQGLIPASLPFTTVRRIRKRYRELLKGRSTPKGYPDINVWRAQI